MTPETILKAARYVEALAASDESDAYQRCEWFPDLFRCLHNVLTNGACALYIACTDSIAVLPPMHCHCICLIPGLQ